MITSFAILLILMAELKVCGWRVSARGSGERSEPALASRRQASQVAGAEGAVADCEFVIFLQCVNVGYS